MEIGTRVKISVGCADAQYHGKVGAITGQDGSYWLVQLDGATEHLLFIPEELEIVEQVA